eukprot:135244_1
MDDGQSMNATLQTEMSLISNINISPNAPKEQEEQEILLTNVSPKRTNRDKSFDMYRGIIMITMALDHLRETMATGVGSVFWYGESSDYYDTFNGDLGLGLFYFVVRFVAQLALPGFMLLMGFGMVHFYEHRHGKLKWSHLYTTLHLVLRGIIIVICGFIQYYTTRFWHSFKKKGITKDIWVSTDVLVPLGLNMILISLFIFFENYSYHNNMQIIKCGNNSLFHPGMILLFIIILFCNISTEMIVPDYTENINTDDYNAITKLLWLGGSFLSFFPLIPWMSNVCVGAVMGRYTWCAMKYKFMDQCMRNYLILGTISFIFFIIIRVFDGFGNFGTPWNGPNASSPWHGMNFWNPCRHPPSLAFRAIFIFIQMTITYFVYIYHRKYGANGSITKIILVFGNTALFFYILHTEIVHLILWQILDASPAYNRKTWTVALLILPSWFIFLLICYPFCKWYLHFKRKKNPKSLWKLF